MQQNQPRKPGTMKPSIDGNMISVILADSSAKKMDVRDMKDWKTHSGTASCGTEVHSLKSCQIGRTTIMADFPDSKKSADGNDVTGVFLTAELEVASKQLFGKAIKG